MSQHYPTTAFAGQTECTETLLAAPAVVSPSKQGRGPVVSVKKIDPLSAKTKGMKAAPGKRTIYYQYSVTNLSEFRSCVKVEVAVLGSPS